MKNIIILCVLFTSCVNNVKKTSNHNISSLSDAGISIEDPSIVYTAKYVSIPYPNGDVDPRTGVCTDVIIRAYRKIGVDLQRLVHEDMSENFEVYPNNWGLTKPNKNIDHRRVPNLMKFFSRHGESLSLSGEYNPGDVVVWRLSGGILHIGLVVNKQENGNNMLIHNIGRGQEIEDVLYKFKIIGHYRY